MVQHVSDVVKIAGQTVERTTLAGLQSASQKSGVSFQYLVAKAAQESSLQTDAQADTSSATGLFQFTRGTWLDMMKKYGSLYGYGELSDKISVNTAGKATVKDAAAENRILALRNDVEASALMAAEYARDNAVSLHDVLGRGVDASDLYLAHFLGASGANQLLSAAQTSPNASAASILPAAAKANTAVFYTPEGRPRTTTEVVKLVRDRFAGQMDRYADVATAMTNTEVPNTNARAAERAILSAPLRPVTMASSTLTANDANAGEMFTKDMVTRMMLEEMAKMIAAKPMAMNDDGEDENTDETALSSNGFQGSDWGAAMTQAMTKDTPADQAALARSIAKGRAGEATRSYDMLNAVPTAAPFVPVRRPTDQK
jgi:hypothetical protein